MLEERHLRLRAETEAAELRDELDSLQDERRRLARKLERLTSTLLELRAAPECSEEAQSRIDDALDYDGREQRFELPSEPDEGAPDEP